MRKMYVNVCKKLKNFEEKKVFPNIHKLACLLVSGKEESV